MDISVTRFRASCLELIRRMLHANGRLTPDRAFDVWIREAAAASVRDVLALDVDVVIAGAHRIPLATHDRAIRRSRVVWLWTPR